MNEVEISKSPESIIVRVLKKYNPDELIESDISSLKEIQIPIANMFVEVDQQKAIESKKNIFLLKILGEIELLKIYIILLKYFSYSIKVSEKMSTMDMLEIAKEYIKTYPYNSVKDFILLLKNIRLAKYGPIYNRLDISVFFEFMTKYENEKCDFLEKRYKDSQCSLLANFPEEIMDKYKNMLHFTIPNAQEIAENYSRKKKLEHIYRDIIAEKIANNEKI